VLGCKIGIRAGGFANNDNTNNDNTSRLHRDGIALRTDAANDRGRNTMSYRTIYVRLFAALLLAAASVSAHAQGASNWPTRPITIIVPVSPGSQADVFARIIADKISPKLGVPVVIENRPGGGQVVGTAAGLKAPPDGYTLLHGNLSGLIISPQLRKPAPYDTTKMAAPITMTLSGPSVLVVDPKLPIKSAAELIAYAKANPGKLNYGSHGAGSFTHVSTEMFKGLTGTDMVHIPYSGGAKLSIGFLSGEVQVVIFDLVSIRPHVDAGKARVIAQVGDRRSPLYPDVPLLSETVNPALAADFWMGMVAPAGTPAPIVERLNKEITAALAAPEIRARGEPASMYPAPISAKAFNDRLAKEWAKWGKVISDRNIQIR
jgi:tripartite-type tricarboxylate transporter receptor subunit TctC